MRRGDRWLVALALLLTAVGLVMVYSAGSFHAFVRYGDSNHFLRQQLVRTLFGLGALFACSRLSLRRLETLAPWLLAGACALLALVVAMGHMTNGATRWLKLGFMSVQPTDLGRLAAVVFMAWWLTGLVLVATVLMAVLSGLATLRILRLMEPISLLR